MTGAFLRTQPRSPTASETFAQDFVLTLWTDDPRLAAIADRAGIQRVGLDLETDGKAERQRGLGTWISPHRIERVPAIRESLRNSRLFARVNPLHRGSREEVERLLDLGVQVLMLPMFTSADDVVRFAELVARRASVVPLLETRAAAEQICELVTIDGIEEVHIGINDLALSLGARCRFDVLNSDVVQRVADIVRRAGLRLGIGAIGRVRDGRLPVPPDLIYARYVQLGASAALIARSYAAPATTSDELRREVTRSRNRLAWWRGADTGQLAAAHAQLVSAVASCASW
jgi:2-keto-3-deoxy-L-rhamnonate aldolase RhmA